MSDERFNQLLNGPLSHPLPMFTITRLALALRAVLDATGDEPPAAAVSRLKASMPSGQWPPIHELPQRCVGCDGPARPPAAGGCMVGVRVPHGALARRIDELSKQGGRL